MIPMAVYLIWLAAFFITFFPLEKVYKHFKENNDWERKWWCGALRWVMAAPVVVPIVIVLLIIGFPLWVWDELKKRRQKAIA